MVLQNLKFVVSKRALSRCTNVKYSGLFRKTPSFSSWKLRSRTYASGGQSSGSGSSSTLWLIGGGTAAAAVGFWYYSQKNDSAGGPSKSTQPKDYKAVHKAIVDLLESDESTSYEDGSYGPIFLRLAWHASGTYDKDTKTGGSNGATMRFVPESGHGANAGLHVARNALEPLKKQFPWISYSDLWTLAGATAVQQMSLGRVKVPWRPGRSDKDESYCTPDGRLPDAALGQKHLRDIFYRMGFNDQEIVALSGGHALGRCHRDRSGFDGPWTFSPTVLTNDFFRLLLNEKWQVRKWDGPKQYTDKQTDSLMMLPTDMSLVQDKEFKKYVQLYADDEDVFFKDFGKVVSRLFELGVPFSDPSVSLNLPYVE